ncbi:MAG TPA: hypothetical protein VIJ12_01940, partial [Candidatus Baltobacteraceae bacterium]
PPEALPAILQPQLHDGEQFRYTMVTNVRTPNSTWPLNTSFVTTVTDRPGTPLRWVEHFTDGPAMGEDRIFSLAPDGSFQDDKDMPSSESNFLYNTALFGDPPQDLAVGSAWQTRIKGTNPIAVAMGIIKVQAVTVDPSRATVKLRFAYHASVRVHYPADHGTPDYSSHDVADATGNVTFESGILTTFSASARNEHDEPDGHRVSYDTTLEMTLVQI